MLEGMEHDALDAGFPRAEMMAVAAAFQYKPVKCPKAVKEDLADFTADTAVARCFTFRYARVVR